MSQVAIIEHNIGNGRGNRVFKTHSAARAWPVTITGKPIADFHYWVSYGGPFSPDERVIAAVDTIKNVGNATAAAVYAKVAELKSDGSVIDEKQVTSYNWAAGQCGTVGAVKDYDGSWIVYFFKKTCEDKGAILIKKKPGTYYFGVKIWCTGETEPAYPRPAALFEAEATEAAPEKWCIPATSISPEICLEPWQWATVGMLGTLACVGTYFAVRSAKGKL